MDVLKGRMTRSREVSASYFSNRSRRISESSSRSKPDYLNLRAPEGGQFRSRKPSFSERIDKTLELHKGHAHSHTRTHTINTQPHSRTHTRALSFFLSCGEESPRLLRFLLQNSDFLLTFFRGEPLLLLLPPTLACVYAFYSTVSRNSVELIRVPEPFFFPAAAHGGTF